jgi:hypothetical protein
MFPSQEVRDLVASASCYDTDHDHFAMSFSHCTTKSLVPWPQLPAMFLMMALLDLTLSLCVILPYVTCRDTDGSFVVSFAVFRRCVTLSQQGAFISLIALLSVLFLLSEGMSFSVVLT